MNSIIYILIYILILYTFHELMRRNIKLALAICILSLLTIPFWGNNLSSPFRIAKTLSVIFPTLFLTLCRYSEKYATLKFLQKPWTSIAFFMIIGINILEASLTDLFVTKNILNGLCGLILCITMPLPKNNWLISIEGNKYTNIIVNNISIAWIFLYTVWDICFVYGENYLFVLSTVSVLLAPFIRALINNRKDLWVSARAYTLFFHLLTRASLGDIFSNLMNSSNLYNVKFLNYFSYINFTLHIIFLIWYYKKVFYNKHHAFKA